MDAPVPGCPEWTAADLWWHLTEVHDFWLYVVAEQSTAPDGYVDPVRPADGELAATYLAGLEELVDALAATDGDVAVWTWTTDHTAGWVLRRMAHETAAHLGDAQQTAGTAPSIDAALASDGIDEFLQWFAPNVPDGTAPLGGSVHLHCTDVAGEWFVVDGAEGGLTVTRRARQGRLRAPRRRGRPAVRALAPPPARPRRRRRRRRPRRPLRRPPRPRLTGAVALVGPYSARPTGEPSTIWSRYSLSP